MFVVRKIDVLRKALENRVKYVCVCMCMELLGCGCSMCLVMQLEALRFY